MSLLPRSLLWIGLLLASSPAWAESVIIGTIVRADTKKPLSDVVITTTSPVLREDRVVITDAQGQYRVDRLPPGNYTLSAEKAEFRVYSRPDVQVRQDRTVRVNVELLPEGGAAPEDVLVPPPTIDVGSATAGINIDQDFVQRMAMNRPAALGGASRNAPPPTLTPRQGVVTATPRSAEPARRNPLNAPDWALPHMLPTQFDGTPQPVYRAPAPPERTEAPSGQRFFDMYFKGYGVNPTVDTEEERFSTFSVDVDTASYTLARGYLQRDGLPEEQAVRVEEFVNRFDYGYPEPSEEPFGIHVEAFASPGRKGYHVLRIGVKAQGVRPHERKPAHLVFVIDVSGSMTIDNRLGLVKESLRMLLQQLDERDRVSLVVYGSMARQVIGPTSVREKERLWAAISSLQTEGSTHAQAGLELGYALAARHLVPGGINRVILCSDGVANQGITDADGIWARVREHAARGITLTSVGFGMGNYNDVLMERLAQVGEGHYVYVDQLDEARRLFVQELTGTLQVVAKDVKVQVEFDRRAVTRYRLLGYENRMLTQEQFADDKVDAAEMGAGHAVTALYEVKLREPGRALGTLRLRYKAPEGGGSRLFERALPASAVREGYGLAEPSTRLAYVAAAFAEKLRGSYWVRTLSYAQLFALWTEIDGQELRPNDVAELGALIQKAGRLDRRVDRFERFAPVSTMDFDRAPVIK